MSSKSPFGLRGEGWRDTEEGSKQDEWGDY